MHHSLTPATPVPSPTRDVVVQFELFRKTLSDDPQAALTALRAVFQQPHCQRVRGRPSDHLSDRDEGKKTLSEGFDLLVSQFAPRPSAADKAERIAQTLVESRNDDADEGHRRLPFNALELVVSTYDWGDATLRSVHLADNGNIDRRYWLEDEVVSSTENVGDDDDWYTFLYDLKRGEYNVTWDGEPVDGEDLFWQVRVAQYAAHLADVVQCLSTSPAFAGFPKALPLQFVLHRNAGDDDAVPLHWHPPLTEASLSSSSLLPLFVQAAQPLPEPPREQRWATLLKTAGANEAHQQDLLALLDDELIEATETLAQAHLRFVLAKRKQQPVDIPTYDDNVVLAAGDKATRNFLTSTWVQLLWAIPQLSEAALQFTQSALELPLPPVVDVERRGSRAEDVVRSVYNVWRATPQKVRTTLQTSFDAACAQLRDDDVNVRLLEAEAHIRLRHGADAVSGGKWNGITYADGVVTTSLVHAVRDVLVELQATPPSKRDLDVVMGRIKGLKAHTDVLLPPLLDALSDLQARNSYRERRVLEDAVPLLHDLGVDAPPEFIRGFVESQSFHNFTFYKAWATRRPSRQFDAFVAAFGDDAESFAAPTAWMAYLEEGTHALALWTQKLAEHDLADDMNKALAQAWASTEAPPLLRALALSLFERYAKDKTRNIERILQLWKHKKDGSDDENRAIRQTRLFALRCKADAHESLDHDLPRLKHDYGEHPMVLWMESEHALHRAGARACAETSRLALRVLGDADPVFRKAVLQFTAASAGGWSDFTDERAYAVFLWAHDELHRVAFRDGVYARGVKTIDRDPWYDGLVRASTQMSDDEKLMFVDEAKAELAFSSTLLEASPSALLAHLSPRQWRITLSICRRLIDAKQHLDKVAEVYAWFKDDPARKRDVLRLGAHHDDVLDALLREPDVQADLGWMIPACPGSTKLTCDRVFNALDRLQLPRVVLAAAAALPTSVVMGSFLGLNKAVQKTADFAAGIDVLDRLLDDMSPKQPEVMLLRSNRAVYQFQGGDTDGARECFEALFAEDWSRFDYEANPDDVMTGILGGDLDAEYAKVFWQYYAMAQYNAACVYAAGGDVERTVAALEVAVNKNPSSYTAEKVASESDFAPVADAPAFQSFLSSLRGAS